MLVLDFIFPKKCLVCDAKGGYLCQKCQSHFSPCLKGICPQCDRLSVGGKTHQKCQSSQSMSGLISIWQYEGVIGEVIKALKYRFVHDALKEICQLAIQVLEIEFSEQNQEFKSFLNSFPIVIPVPLHKRRLYWRGFNQAEILGRNLAEIWQLPFSGKVLSRIKETQPQVELKGKQRQQNIARAFSLKKSLKNKGRILQGKRFLLVDDVWTTGATMRECCRVLKKTGAKAVWGITLAR